MAVGVTDAFTVTLDVKPTHEPCVIPLTTGIPETLVVPVNVVVHPLLAVNTTCTFCVPVELNVNVDVVPVGVVAVPPAELHA